MNKKELIQNVECQNEEFKLQLPQDSKEIFLARLVYFEGFF